MQEFSVLCAYYSNENKIKLLQEIMVNYAIQGMYICTELISFYSASGHQGEAKLSYTGKPVLLPQ